MDEEEEIKIEADLPAQAGEDEMEEKAEQKIAKMREELTTCRKDKQEYMDGWQRAKADYVNAFKRFEGDLKSAKQGGVVKAVEALLPAFDALERSKEHLPAQAGGEFAEGFLAIAKQLESAFAGLGLEEIGTVGEKFDPALHEALGQDAAENAETDDTVTAVLEKGWKIDEFVIRPAKVRIAHFTSS